MAIRVGFQVLEFAIPTPLKMFFTDLSLKLHLENYNLIKQVDLSKLGTVKIPSGLIFNVGEDDKDTHFGWSTPVRAAMSLALQNTILKYSNEAMHSGESSDNGQSSKPRIDAGVSTDSVCAKFDGDRKDHNAANADAVREAIGNVFADIRAAEQKRYNKANKGWIEVPGQPSMLAFELHAKKWYPLHASESELDPMKDIVKFENDILTRATKGTIATTSTQDGTFVTCTWRDGAQALRGNEPEKGKKKANEAESHARWCPEPEDPTQICYVGRFDHSYVGASKVTAMAGLESLETWNSNRIHLNRTDLLQESSLYYQLNGNDDEPRLDESIFQVKDDPIFSLPTCYMNVTLINDNKYHADNRPLEKVFPFRCGGWRAEFSAGFMAKAGYGPGSKIYTELHHAPDGLVFPREIYTETIPRLIHRVKDITPLSSYITFGANGIRPPTHQDKKGVGHWQDLVHVEVDQDSQLISDATLGMTETEGNEWFCDPDNHTVFDRQLEEYKTNGRKIDAHKRMCKAWKEKHKHTL